jgi:hypothetical protein
VSRIVHMQRQLETIMAGRRQPRRHTSPLRASMGTSERERARRVMRCGLAGLTGPSQSVVLIKNGMNSGVHLRGAF